MIVTVPVIVVEVVSPSRDIDTDAKLVGYSRAPSVQHHLVVAIAGRTVTYHRRGGVGGIETRILRDGALALDPPGIEVAVEAFFAGL